MKKTASPSEVKTQHTNTNLLQQTITALQTSSKMNIISQSLLSLLAFQSFNTICVALPKYETKLGRNQLENRRMEVSSSHRQLTECAVSSTLSTEEYRGGFAAKGVYFDFESYQEVQLLSIEFAVAQDAPQSIPVQVYFREGSFSQVNGQPQAWTKVADTAAQRSPENTTAIVPVMDFQSSTMEANTVYALYISMDTTDILFAQLSDSSIGLVSKSDGVLEQKVGVTVSDGPFPETLATSKIAEFMGVLHYKSHQQCSSVLETTKVDLEFAINGFPSAAHLNELAASFGEAIDAVFVMNSTLVESKRKNMIHVNDTVANFMGRSGTFS